MATLINQMGAFVLLTLTFALARNGALDAAGIGIINGLRGVGSTVGALIGGICADRWGRRKVIALGYTTSAVLMLLLIPVWSAPVLGFLAVALGVSGAFSQPAAIAAVADVVPADDTARAYSLNTWATNIGLAGCSAVVGIFSDKHIPLLFTLDAATTFAAGVILVIGLPQRTDAGVETKSDGDRPGIAYVFRDRVFVGFVAVGFISGLLLSQQGSSLPLDMALHHVGPRVYAAIFMINCGMIIALQPYVPNILRKLDQSVALACGAAILGAGFGLSTLGPGFAGYAVAAVVWTCGQMVGSCVAPSLMMKLVRSDLRGSYQGVAMMAFTVSSAVGPIVGGYCLQEAGRLPLWGGCAVAGLVGAALHLMSRQQRNRRAAQLASRDEQTAPPSASTASAQ
ncbi:MULTISPECIES: MFS transporter [Streptomyces]|nr:MFS transporter [Streptomyces monashensis]